MFTIPLSYQSPLKGNNIGVVFGSFAPLHQGHLDMIFRAKKENDGGCMVIVCGNAGDKGGNDMPLRLRYQYVREFFKDDDLVAVYAIDDGVLGFEDYAFENWNVWIKEFIDILQSNVNGVIPHITWYVGEKEYYHDLVSLGYDCRLLDRSENPISATLIRENPLKYWNKIALPFRRVFSHNILIIGTACEGKSILTMDLAKYFSTSYAHEWPRDYMEKYALADWDLNSEHFIEFLAGQHRHVRMQIESPENSGVFFCDSSAVTTDMYAHHYSMNPECALDWNNYIAHIEPLADHLISMYRWDKIFVLPPHGKFVDDHSRYMHDASIEERIKLYTVMKNKLQSNPRLQNKIVILNGGYNENFEAIKAYVKGLYNE